MKHDPYFKFLAVVIFAGVLLALFDPMTVVDNAPAPTAVIATAAH